MRLWTKIDCGGKNDCIGGNEQKRMLGRVKNR